MQTARLLISHLRAWFPDIPNQPGYNKRLRHSGQLLQHVIGYLARQCPSDPRFADRFEVFFGPHELANGYVELTDYGEQKNRFADDQRVRKTRGQSIRPLDTDFLDAMRAGNWGLEPMLSDQINSHPDYASRRAG